jgi:tRNA A-37 threonylcarbamoyl transferase component Bud32
MDRYEQAASVRAGDILAGKYRIDRVLGVGGMGVVVAAHHLQLDERVAIKFLLPEMLAQQDAVMRFSREARAAVKIKSEHVARVTDVGTLETGAPYMVMEYLEGADLAELVRRGPLPLTQAVDFVLQACEAIAEAHALGIVHRDLKPANLFLATLPGGVQSVKVLDFGISKLTGLSASGGQDSATRTKALMGSPLYMSPEQMESSKDVDVRSDLWALGIIVYELIAGVSPFVADTMPELILRIMSSAPPSLRERRADVPAGLDAAILRCLVKDRAQRWQSVGDLAAALAPFGTRKARLSAERIAQVMGTAGTPGSAPWSPLDSLAPPAAVSAVGGTAAAFGTSVHKPQRSRPLLVLAGSALVVGIVAAAYAGQRLWRHEDSPASRETPLGVTTRSVSASAPPAPPVEPAPNRSGTPAPQIAPAPQPQIASAPDAQAVPAPAVAPSAARATSPRPATPAVARHFTKASTPAAPAPAAAPAAATATASPNSKKASPSSLIDERY